MFVFTFIQLIPTVMYQLALHTPQHFQGHKIATLVDQSVTSLQEHSLFIRPSRTQMTSAFQLLIFCFVQNFYTYSFPSQDAETEAMVMSIKPDL
jgi:hypothetical protein